MDAACLRALRDVLGPKGLIEDRASRTPYESDGLAFERRLPDLVLLPANTDEAARAMRVLHEHGVPVVPRGAGTGLTGGATPVEGGVVIGTARMRRILELDPTDRFARVEAGLVNVDLSRACAPHGLFYAPDPSSQRVCTLGGNVANNAGGPHCFRYGSTTRHVLGLVLVAHDGSVLDLAEPHLDPLGYDLTGLLVGSEGMFGLVTEITVKLLPAPERVETLLATFSDLDAACDAVSDVIAARLEPSALEILDKLTIEAVEASVFAAGYPADAEAVLLVEVEGSEAEVRANATDIGAILAARGALETRRAESDEARAKLWAGRKGAYGAMGRVAPDLYVTDVVVPRTKLRALVRETTDICRELELPVANVFHAGDGNLHPNISYDRRDPDQVRRVLEAGQRIMEVCLAAGGTLSGEHGIGLEKQRQMALYFSPADLDAMERPRDVFDPHRRMNPGKTLPIRACMETKTRPLGEVLP